MNLFFSFIVPVYNRPEEIRELLESLSAQTSSEAFEVVIIEDGSTEPSEQVIVDYIHKHSEKKDRFSVTYLKKPNSGPGSSRNYGMTRAKGDYFIILDSDCILPPQYLDTVAESLQENFVHCYGGPDAAHESFSLVQKAINYAMTAVLTTGGIRGGKTSRPKAGGNKNGSAPSKIGTGRRSVGAPRRLAGFQPRSFNMGLSKLAFETSGGFGDIHPGEDPDLIFRIWGEGYGTRLIPEAFVFHKRRIDWKKFFVQVKKFGMVRPILNRRYPKTAKMTYWFPTFFCLGFLVTLVLWYLGIVLPIILYASYFGIIFIDSLIKNRSLSIAILSLVAVGIQFVGYGFGFLKSVIFVNFSKKKAEELFPQLFFKNTNADTAV